MENERVQEEGEHLTLSTKRVHFLRRCETAILELEPLNDGLGHTRLETVSCGTNCSKPRQDDRLEQKCVSPAAETSVQAKSEDVFGSDSNCTTECRGLAVSCVLDWNRHFDILGASHRAASSLLPSIDVGSLL